MEKEKLELLIEDILEEIKQVRFSSNEQQKEIKEVKEKLSSFEQKMNTKKEVTSIVDIKPLHEEISKGFMQIQTLITNMPSTIHVEHKHHLHKGILISIVLLAISILSSFGWFKSYTNEKLYEANDIKYRSLKLTNNKALLNLLYFTDTLYKLNCDNFRIKVIEEENEISHQADSIRLLMKRKMTYKNKRSKVFGKPFLLCKAIRAKVLWGNKRRNRKDSKRFGSGTVKE
ncbi:MAG: hypothetical protein ACR2FN_09285 [Chitinophagaceae bacterium]